MSACPDIDTTLAPRIPCTYYIKAPDTQGYCSRKDHYRCIEYIVKKNPVLSTSSIATYNMCLRKFYYIWLMGWQLIELNLIPICGNIVHGYVEHLHTNNSKFLIEAQALENRLREQFKDKLPVDLLYIKPAVNAYAHHGLHKISGQAEVSKIINFGNYQIKSIVDLKLEDRIIDLKFTKNPDYYSFFTTEQQAGIYLLSYPDHKKITFSCIRKPDPWKTKPAKNEKVDEFQKRVYNDMTRRKSHYFIDKTFHRAEYDFARIEGELFHTADEILSNLGKPIEFWRQDRNSCWQFNSWCDFYTCCSSRIEPENLPNIYKQRSIENVIYEAK